MKLLAFCEAPADFRLMSGLVDLVLRESGPPWVVDSFDTPEVVRTWQPDESGRDYIDVHSLNDYADQLRARGLLVRRVRGHFDGRPGHAGSAMARKAFLIAEAFHRHTPAEPIDAVVLLWDTDEQPDERRDGVRAARDEARRWARFKIVCVFPNPEREAWVLAGFDPCDHAEQQLLDDLHRELGFSPVLHAVHLRDKDPGTLRNIKRVLDTLTREDVHREARCWTEPSLTILRARGGPTGLAAFLDELEAMLLALCGARPPRT